MRAHIILDDGLVNDIDGLVGKRKRSRFIAEAVRAHLRRARLAAALKETAGVISAKEHPEWETPQDSANWVRETRRLEGSRGKRM